MPELPEVETIRAGLAARLQGARVADVTLREPRLRAPVQQDELDLLFGARLTRFRRRAKYLLMDTDRATTLVVHLGMSGRMIVGEAAAPLDAHDHLLFDLIESREGSVQLRFRDPRRFGLVRVLATAEIESHALFAHLGPEPLGPAFSLDHLVAAAAGRRVPVKSFLMDARIVVGVGNIYASEALWRAGIHPRRAAGRISAARLERLRGAVRAVLREAIEAGGTTLRDYRDPDGNLGYFAIALRVYDRAGEECSRCRSAVRRLVQGGRATYYCPGCQR